MDVMRQLPWAHLRHAVQQLLLSVGTATAVGTLAQQPRFVWGNNLNNNRLAALLKCFGCLTAMKV